MAFYFRANFTGWLIPRRNKRFLGFFVGIVLTLSIVYQRMSLISRIHNRAKYRIGNTSSDFDDSRQIWLIRRKHYLEKRNPIKLFLFSYMRGGSSIAGELFNCDPSATMWYEPGDAFFSSYYGLYEENLPQNDLYFRNLTRRKLNSDELKAMLDFYKNIFSCNYNELPPETMAHSFLKESTAMDGYVQCMKGKRTKNVNIKACNKQTHNICSSNMVETSIGAKCHSIIVAVKEVLNRNIGVRRQSTIVKLLQNYLITNSIELRISDLNRLYQFIRRARCIEQMREDNAKCVNIVERKCKNDALRVVQVNRMKMEDLEIIIKANPDIYVVHYTRDPRAIALSRYKTGILLFDKVNRSTVREAQFICDKMREDIRQRLILEKKYPGVFTHLSYESLVTNPDSFAKKVYGLFSKAHPKKWSGYFAKTTRGNGKTGPFAITVKNVTEAAFAWKSHLQESELKTINTLCADVITYLGYKL